VSFVLAFDVYGTLVDPQGIASAVEPLAGVHAEDLARLWRVKQLEYSFRRGLMKTYADFDVCTRDALAYACSALDLDLTEDETRRLMAAYRRLPAYPEAIPALHDLQSEGHRLLAFSNGTPESLSAVLGNAGLRNALSNMVSVHEIGSFKPDPAVYRHFEQRAGAPANAIWLVSANPFDVLGAINVGWRAAWVKRSGSQPFDPWGGSPTAEIADLGELKQALSAFHRGT
jgi:2-haloacid dehalogenase